MEKKNDSTVFEISPAKAKYIVKDNFYFNNYNKDSEFAALPPNLQRAINREAEFHVKTLAQTKGFSDILTADNNKEAQKLHNTLCEYMAHVGNLEEAKNPHNPNNKFAILLKKDSDEIFKQNFEATLKDAETAAVKDEYNLHPTSRRAKHYNEDIEQHEKKGIRKDASTVLQNLYAHLTKHLR